jgi:hypothetical protein
MKSISIILINLIFIPFIITGFILGPFVQAFYVGATMSDDFLKTWFGSNKK